MADDFETALSPDLASDEQALIVDVEGFEGPLDLLLTLARQQKVDLAKISILALADQYLAFIEEARKIRLELAGGSLVIAAWVRLHQIPSAEPSRRRRYGSEPRGHGARARAAAAPPRSDPQRRRPADRPPAAWPRRVRPRRPRAGRRHQAPGLDRDALRPAHGLCGAAPEERAFARAFPAAHGVVARRGARGAGAPCRFRAGLEPARPIPDLVSGRAVDALDRDGVELRGSA